VTNATNFPEGVSAILPGDFPCRLRSRALAATFSRDMQMAVPPFSLSAFIFCSYQSMTPEPKMTLETKAQFGR